MDILIRDNLRTVMESNGPRGVAWLAELPAQVERLCSSWSIEIGEVLVDVDGISWIATVGSDAILKVGWPHREAAYEAAGLRFFDGQGAVRLRRSSEDGFALLMERCLPGHDLWAIGVDEGNAVAAEVLRRLWRPAGHNHGFELLSDVVEEWMRSWPSGEYPSAMVAAASEIARSLCATQPEIVVLHGDFHPGNVLRAQRDGWLAIDCKPMVGEPAYDLAQYLADRADAARALSDPIGELVRQIGSFAKDLALDTRRIAGWAVVKSIGWDWGPDTTRLFMDVMQVCKERPT